MLASHAGSDDSISFDPKCRLFVLVAMTAKLWNVTACTERRTLSAHKRWAESVTFNSDGRFLASGGEDVYEVWLRQKIELGFDLG